MLVIAQKTGFGRLTVLKAGLYMLKDIFYLHCFPFLGRKILVSIVGC